MQQTLLAVLSLACLKQLDGLFPLWGAWLCFPIESVTCLSSLLGMMPGEAVPGHAAVCLYTDVCLDEHLCITRAFCLRT